MGRTSQRFGDKINNTAIIISVNTIFGKESNHPAGPNNNLAFNMILSLDKTYLTTEIVRKFQRGKFSSHWQSKIFALFRSFEAF